MSYQKISVGISSCLLGENVRYDGGNKRNDFIIDRLGHFFDFRPYCPEVNIGLGVPRPTIYLTDIKVSDIGVLDRALEATLQHFEDELIEQTESFVQAAKDIEAELHAWEGEPARRDLIFAPTGEVVQRFGTSVDPMSSSLQRAVRSLL